MPAASFTATLSLPTCCSTATESFGSPTFGLAKTGDHGLTHTGDVLGTIRYMSPERFGGQCDVRADVYSLGLTLYELLTLKPAFGSSDHMNLIERIKSTAPALPRAIDSRVPRDLETIVLKSIDKDPKRRYQSADDFEADLQRFIDDEPIRARRVSLPERFVRWSRRNRSLAAALTVIFSLLTVGLVGSAAAAQYFRNQEQQQRQLADEEEQSRKTAESHGLPSTGWRGPRAAACSTARLPPCSVVSIARGAWHRHACQGRRPVAGGSSRLSRRLRRQGTDPFGMILVRCRA